MAGREIFNRPIPDLPADEAEGGEAYCGRHAAHLAIAALGDGEGEPVIGHALAKAHGRVAIPKGGWIDQFCDGRAGGAIG